MGDKFLSKTSPLKNWYPYLPVALRGYDMNDDSKINPREICGPFTDTLFTLDDTDLEKFFYNSTSIVPKIMEGLKDNASPKARHVEDVFGRLEEKRSAQLKRASIIADNVVGLIEFSGLIERRFLLRRWSEMVSYEPMSKHLASPGYRRVVGDIDAIIKTLPDRFVDTFGLPKNEVEDVIKRTRVAVMDRTSQYRRDHHRPEENLICSDITDINFNGTSSILMDNCHARNAHSHQTDIVHEMAHAVTLQLLGAKLFYPDGTYNNCTLPKWISEGLAAYAAENLLELTTGTLCKEGRSSQMTKQCTLDDEETKGMNNFCINEMIAQADCFEDNFENPLACLKDYLLFKNIEDYFIYGAAFTWLGREYVHQFVKALYDGEFYKDALIDIMSKRLEKDVKTYGEAEEILTAYAIRELYITLRSAGINLHK